MNVNINKAAFYKGCALFAINLEDNETPERQRKKIGEDGVKL